MDTSAIVNTLLIVAVAWFLYSRFAPIKGLKTMSAGQFETALKNDSNKLLIDVREPHEVKSGFIPGAVNIPLSQLDGRMGEIPKDKHVYLYCRSGMRSKQAARRLSKNGFADMAQLQGGILSWSGQVRK